MPHRGPSPSNLDSLAVGLVLGALAAVAVTFAPWHHSGSATRNSYELLASADRLGIVQGGANRALAAAWPLVPLTMALGGVAIALGRKTIGALLILTAGILEVVGAVIVLRADSGLRWGPRAALVVGLSVVVVAVVVVVRAGIGSSVDEIGAGE